MSGGWWWIAAGGLSIVLLIGVTVAALMFARTRQLRVLATELDRDHWRRIAEERGAEADRLARESARLTRERLELLSRLREAESASTPTAVGSVERDASALRDRLRTLAPAAVFDAIDGPHGPEAKVSLTVTAGSGVMRPLRGVPAAVGRARERGLQVQPSDQGHRFAVSAKTDALLGSIATALLEDAYDRFGQGAQVQLALHCDAPDVAVSLLPQ